MSTTTDLPPQAAPPPGPPPGMRRSRRDVWLIVLVVLAVLAVIAAITLVAVTRDDQPAQSGPSSSAAPSSAAPTSAGASSAPSSATPSASATAPQQAPFGYQPLWPFSTPAQAQAWQQSYRTGGHSPWHLDADQTALSFTTGYLGFTDVNVVTWHSIEGDEALVAVGFRIEDHSPGTAAVLHLARYGTGADAPWEVVGSKDSTLTLTTPAYGAEVSSPMAVGGRITGVDESIHVQVRQPGSTEPIGESPGAGEPGLPAGGQDSPWSTTVAYHGPTAPALTVVAWTGGHVAAVEKFAITGVRP